MDELYIVVSKGKLNYAIPWKALMALLYLYQDNDVTPSGDQLIGKAFELGLPTSIGLA